MKFNKRIHFIIWALYFLSLFLYKKFEIQYAVFAAYAFMAVIIFQIIKWALYIPEPKGKIFENKKTV